MTRGVEPDPRRLGRRPAFDDRDRRFALQRVSVPPTRTSKYWLCRGGPLDQGYTSQCVAYAGTRYLTTHPVVNVPHLMPHQLYLECQRLDEWPGEEPDYEGTSVRALFKVLKRDGFITEYRWAWNAEMVMGHLLMTGPMVLGTDWTERMFDPDPYGFIWDEGESFGGHAYLAIGANRKKPCPDGSTGAIRILNSWSGSWGQNGRAWMSLKVLDRLLTRHGEACIATEIKRAA
ncbi:hypothetical protein [Microvirga massiliensis]|uniref:hypothetical protein n=1 Tax=Microvirga massiliensis TaxID=1033741 RepID=UPI000AFECDFB|nr:hypothetical protein [Microvirga massiliensis]